MRELELREGPRSEQFLKLYRVLEGLLEKRYSGKRVSSPSVVMEYLRDADSAPCREDLDLCREIRNLLSHNADSDGDAIVEPSQSAVDMLQAIVEYVQRPRLAVDCGTTGERIMFAHPNDSALDVIRHMLRMGYSHVPVRTKSGLVGVFSASGLMSYIGRAGLEGQNDSLRIGDLKDALNIDDRYLFMDATATVTEVREAFDRHRERNRRLAVIFITEDGTWGSPVQAMLTPWDVLKDTE